MYLSSEICFLNKPSFASLLVITGALGALYLIDKQGRQKLLIGSYLGMVSCTWIILGDDDKLTISLTKKFYLCVGTFDVSCGLCYQFSTRWATRSQLVNTGNSHVNIWSLCWCFLLIRYILCFKENSFYIISLCTYSQVHIHLCSRSGPGHWTYHTRTQQQQVTWEDHGVQFFCSLGEHSIFIPWRIICTISISY